MDTDKNLRAAVGSFEALSVREKAILLAFADYAQAEDNQLTYPYDFSRFMYKNKLTVVFDWTEWQEGRDWFALQDDSKYDSLDVATALKLFTAVIRNDRFSDGVLAAAFESGVFPKILQKLITF